MKYIYLLVVFASLNGFSQEKKHLIIKSNGLHYLVKTGFNISSEIKKNNNHSLNFAFEIGNNQYNYVTQNRNKFVVVVVERRNYLKIDKVKNNLSGFFSSPYLKYRYKDKNVKKINGFFTSTSGKFKAHSLGCGFAVGYQNFIFKRIAVEGKLGLGIIFRVTSKGETMPTFVQPDGILGLSFGIRI